MPICRRCELRFNQLATELCFPNRVLLAVLVPQHESGQVIALVDFGDLARSKVRHHHVTHVNDLGGQILAFVNLDCLDVVAGEGLIGVAVWNWNVHVIALSLKKSVPPSLLMMRECEGREELSKP